MKSRTSRYHDTLTACKKTPSRCPRPKYLSGRYLHAALVIHTSFESHAKRPILLSVYFLFLSAKAFSCFATNSFLQTQSASCPKDNTERSQTYCNCIGAGL